MRLELAQKIEDAFANTIYPGDDNIGDSMLEEFVGQRDWRQVPLKTLLWNRDEISLFEPEAFQFYIPAFLCAVLRDPEAEEMVEFAVVALMPSSIPSIKANVEWAYNLFSNSQKAVISEFLRMHQDLFPQSAFNLLDARKSQLQRAIQFWDQP